MDRGEVWKHDGAELKETVTGDVHEASVLIISVKRTVLVVDAKSMPGSLEF